MTVKTVRSILLAALALAAAGWAQPPAEVIKGSIEGPRLPSKLLIAALTEEGTLDPARPPLEVPIGAGGRFSARLPSGRYAVAYHPPCYPVTAFRISAGSETVRLVLAWASGRELAGAGAPTFLAQETARPDFNPLVRGRTPLKAVPEHLDAYLNRQTGQFSLPTVAASSSSRGQRGSYTSSLPTGWYSSSYNAALGMSSAPRFGLSSPSTTSLWSGLAKTPSFNLSPSLSLSYSSISSISVIKMPTIPVSSSRTTTSSLFPSLPSVPIPTMPKIPTPSFPTIPPSLGGGFGGKLAGGVMLEARLWCEK